MTRYVERLRPSPAAWLLVPVGAAMAGASAYPLGLWIAVGAAAVVGVAVAALLALRTPVVRVDAGGLHAGPAFLGAAHVGEVEPLDAAATRSGLGPELRADAFVLHRPWVRTAVRVGVADEADPTPYWMISTRRPAELAGALVQCRDAAGGRRKDPGSGDQAAHSEQTG